MLMVPYLLFTGTKRALVGEQGPSICLAPAAASSYMHSAQINNYYSAPPLVGGYGYGGYGYGGGLGLTFMPRCDGLMVLMPEVNACLNLTWCIFYFNLHRHFLSLC